MQSVTLWKAAVLQRLGQALKSFNAKMSGRRLKKACRQHDVYKHGQIASRLGQEYKLSPYAQGYRQSQFQAVLDCEAEAP
jgi:hypothetical protein